MGRAKRLGSGTSDAGLAIEYVRTRRVIRLLGWRHGQPIEPVEIPVDHLCQELGIDPRDMGSPRHYLLFAGPHTRPAGGLRDLVGTFESEERAWEAFRTRREGQRSAQGWAELAAIDGLGQLNQLAWFGLHPAEDGGDEPPPRPDRQSGAPSPRRRGASGADVPPYLRAVTPS